MADATRGTSTGIVGPRIKTSDGMSVGSDGAN